MKTNRDFKAGQRVVICQEVKPVADRIDLRWIEGWDTALNDLPLHVIATTREEPMLMLDRIQVRLPFDVSSKHSFGGLYQKRTLVVPVECIKPFRAKSKSTGIRPEQITEGCKVRLKRKKGGFGGCTAEDCTVCKNLSGRVVRIRRAYYKQAAAIGLYFAVTTNGPREMNAMSAIRLEDIDPAYGVKA